MSSVNQPSYPLVFATLVTEAAEIQRVYRLSASLRAFGGDLSQAPLWLFTTLPLADFPGLSLTAQPGLEIIPLQTPAGYPGYPFLDKVFACAQAEARGSGSASTLVWINPECLVVNPPLAFELHLPYQAALRPVHHRNIGSLAGEPLDEFWAGIYRALGLREAPFFIQSMVDGQFLRPYFNTHCFAVNSQVGLMAAWLEFFLQLIHDSPYQQLACRAPLERIFLHQAVLSTLLAQRLGQAHILSLPPTYSYPLHLHDQIPAHLQASRLDGLTVAVYEEEQYLEALPAAEPLQAWLTKYVLPGG